MTQNNTNIVKEESKDVANADILDMFNIDENMDGTVPRLPSIEVLHQVKMFELPDGSTTRTVQGILLDSNRVNAYWPTKFGEGGSKSPTCCSYDGLTPDDKDYEEYKKQSDLCSSCEHNRFGSDGKRGKSCQNKRRVHLLINGDLLPHRITLPPTSLYSYDSYMSQLYSKNRHAATVVTGIALKEESNKDGASYSTVVFTKIDEINNRDQLIEILNLKKKLSEQMQTEDIVAGEFSGDM